MIILQRRHGTASQVPSSRLMTERRDKLLCTISLCFHTGVHYTSRPPLAQCIRSTVIRTSGRCECSTSVTYPTVSDKNARYKRRYDCTISSNNINQYFPSNLVHVIDILIYYFIDTLIFKKRLLMNIIFNYCNKRI